MRHDAVRKPLQPPYHGPYPVLKRTGKLYINGRKDTVSINRLKPTYLDIDSHFNTHPQSQTSSHATTTIRVTCSGRHVHWPKPIGTYVS